MRRPEAEMWSNRVRPALEELKGQLVYSRHEDRATVGVPDLSFAARGAGGWVELKRTRAPKNANRKIRITHLTQQQVGFLELRGLMGQAAFVLVQTDHQDGTPAAFYLFGHWDARALTEGLRYSEWPKRAAACWSGRIVSEQLLDVLAGHQRGRRS